MSKRIEFEVEGDKVRVKIVERDTWGRIKRTTRHTFNRRQFEYSLRVSNFRVPWDKVTP